MAVVYALLAAVSFGGLALGIRLALTRGADPYTGALAAMVVAVIAASLVALPSAIDGFDLGKLWPFLIGGALAPGASQILLNQAVVFSGVARPAVVIGTAPLISVLIALAFLDEPFRWLLLLGTAVIVAGGVTIAREGVRPENWRPLGLVFALMCAVLFAARDNVFRYGARDAHPPPLVAATASLVAAVAVLALYLVAFRREQLASRLRAAFLPFAPAGVSLAAGYGFLALAFDKGRVSIVAPLNGTQSLFSIAFTALVFRRAELIGPRLLLAALLIVAGGALVGATR